ncbi:MAG TPA: hypothetical protein VGK22_16810 [Candidatus Angelobacter sp.]|jgi:hypothetical protein
MDGFVDILALLIGVVALFALLRLFSISNDVKAIREHICGDNAVSQTSDKARTSVVP